MSKLAVMVAALGLFGTTAVVSALASPAATGTNAPGQASLTNGRIQVAEMATEAKEKKPAKKKKKKAKKM